MVQITSHTDKIKELGNKMVDNLKAQGVSASFEDGGMTLAEKILDIKPFTTTILLSATPTIVPIGVSTTIEVEGTLKAQYSDSYVNIDTPIKNQEILLKYDEASQVLQTDTDGNFSISINSQSLSLGTHTFQADFDGVSFYPACESSSATIDIRKYHTDITPVYISRQQCRFTVINTDTNEGISSATCTVTIMTIDGQTSQENFTTDSTGAVAINTGGQYVTSWTIDVEESDTYESVQKTFNTNQYSS